MKPRLTCWNHLIHLRVLGCLGVANSLTFVVVLAIQGGVLLEEGIEEGGDQGEDDCGRRREAVRDHRPRGRPASGADEEGAPAE